MPWRLPIARSHRDAAAQIARPACAYMRPKRIRSGGGGVYTWGPMMSCADRLLSATYDAMQDEHGRRECCDACAEWRDAVAVAVALTTPPPGTITTADFADGAVTTAKIGTL